MQAYRLKEVGLVNGHAASRVGVDQEWDLQNLLPGK